MNKRKQLIEGNSKEEKNLKAHSLALKRKCELLGVPRSSMYYQAVVQDTSSDEEILKQLRFIYQDHPYYGYRRMTIKLRELGIIVNHKKVLSLLRRAGIKAIYPKKRTTIRNPEHNIFPYLLKDINIERPNQVWQVDITYIKIRGYYVYLICLIDVFSRKIMAWKLATTLDAASCLEVLTNALKDAKPDIINSDQGCQFTSEPWVSALKKNGILISMDGKGRWADNIYIERLWRTIKYEVVYLHSFDTVQQARHTLAKYIIFYNQQRPHQSLNYHTPDYVFAKKIIPTKQELFDRFALEYVQFTETCMIQDLRISYSKSIKNLIQ